MNNSVTVTAEGTYIVRVGQFVKIDYTRLIENVSNLTRVVWKKDNANISNMSHVNTFISQDERFIIITAMTLNNGGELGNAGCYTCTGYCGGDSNMACINETSCLIICGKSFV